MFLGMIDTIGELPELVRIAADLGVSRIVLQEMAEYETTRGQSLAWRDRALGRRIYNEARAIADSLGVELALQPCDQFEEPAEKEDFKEAEGERRRHLKKDCFLPWKMAVLTTGGDVIPCCAMFTVMGNVGENRFSDIWRGGRFRALRRELLSEDPPPVCVNCQARGWREDDWTTEWTEARSLLAFSARIAFRRNPLLRRLRPCLKVLRGSAH